MLASYTAAQSISKTEHNCCAYFQDWKQFTVNFDIPKLKRSQHASSMISIQMLVKAPEFPLSG
jgi:hypothetical protein